MGTIDFFFHGSGCSVDLVCRLPNTCINTDVPGLANGTLQKAAVGEGGGGSLFVSRGHLTRRYLPWFDEKLCVSALTRTSVSVCVCVYVATDVFKKLVRTSVNKTAASTNVPNTDIPQRNV